MLQGNIHLNIKPVRRAMGQSLVACLAYQLGISMHDPRTGDWHNYDYKHSEVGGTWLIAPHIEIDNLDYIKKFWGNVELHHKRKDAVPGRRMSIALPLGLSITQMHQLMWMYACWMRDKYGVAVQITGHKLESENPHFHICISACAVSADGIFGKKVESLDPIRARQIDKTAVTQVEIMRERWADMVNAACLEYGVQASVDHSSYKRRGIDKIPQKHEGVWRHSKTKHFSNCPIGYNKNINITNEVLYEHREDSHGITGGSISLEKNEPSRMVGNEGRVVGNYATPEQIDGSGQQIAEGSGYPDGNDGTGQLVLWGDSADQNPKLENGGGHSVTDKPEAVGLEFENGKNGNSNPGSKSSPILKTESLIDIVVPALNATISTLEINTFNLEKRILKTASLISPLSQVSSIGFADITAKGLAGHLEAMEQNVLLLENRMMGLALQRQPEIVLHQTGLIESVSAPLAECVLHTGNKADMLGNKMLKFIEQIERKAGGTAPGSAGIDPLVSAPPAQEKKKPTNDEKLWAIIVRHAESQPEHLGYTARVLNACLEVSDLLPQLKPWHFMVTLKKHSVRTPEEQAHIITELTRAIRQRGTQQKAAEVATVTVIGNMPMDARNGESHPPPSPQAAQEAHPALMPTPERAQTQAPLVQRINLLAPQPESRKSTIPASTPAPPTKHPANESLFNVGAKGRLMLDKIIAAQNLPADARDERLQCITNACITLWEHNPQFSVEIIEEIISQKLLFQEDQKKVLEAVLRHRPQAKPEANEGALVQNNAVPADSHTATANNGHDDGENPQASTIA